MQDPHLPHMQTGLRVLRYLLRDPGLGLFMSSTLDFKLLAFCDSDYILSQFTQISEWFLHFPGIFSNFLEIEETYLYFPQFC
ncbi:hypothetical protein MTR67_034675 [Solanum verrucosum]|uniref:Uncharacterized protein n=1 Tax=Solanum verrucosum TaxID=315347 RepID=A0AAF0U887_SOLVR|nr:hypothetical protein MTR67_034675 [Solanum verrucosum]